MREIKIKDKIILVDDDIYEAIKPFSISIHNRKNIETGVDLRIPLSRFVLKLKTGDKRQADHINHDVLNNTRNNLRVATCQQNNINKKKKKGGKSKFKGVELRPNQRWRSMIVLDGKKIYLGIFQNEIDAAKAYDLAAHNLFGEYACLNFPNVIYPKFHNIDEIRSYLGVMTTKKTSRYPGVYWNERDKKWIAQITKDKKRFYIGCFDNEEDAAMAYNKKVDELFNNMEIKDVQK